MVKILSALAVAAFLQATAANAQDEVTHNERLDYVMKFLKANPYGIDEELENAAGSFTRIYWPVVINNRVYLDFSYRNGSCVLIAYTFISGSPEGRDVYYRDEGCDGNVSETLVSVPGEWGSARPYEGGAESQPIYERHLKRFSMAVVAFKMLTNQVAQEDLKFVNEHISKDAGQILSENLKLTKALPTNESGDRQLEIDLGLYTWIRLADVDSPEHEKDTNFCSNSIWAPEFLNDGPGSSEGYYLNLYLADCQGSVLAFEKNKFASGKRAGREKIEDDQHRLLVIYASNILLHLWDDIIRFGRTLEN